MARPASGIRISIMCISRNSIGQVLPLAHTRSSAPQKRAALLTIASTDCRGADGNRERVSSIFPLRASCAFVCNWVTGVPMARLIAYPMAQANKVGRPMTPIRMTVLSSCCSRWARGLRT